MPFSREIPRTKQHSQDEDQRCADVVSKCKPKETELAIFLLGRLEYIKKHGQCVLLQSSLHLQGNNCETSYT